MPPTNGRGNVLSAVWVWRREDASAMQYLAGKWDWVAVVPVSQDRPAWIPRGAQLHALGAGETAYTWSE